MYDMKETLSECSVCCDTESMENQMLFCGGSNCDVVVHQACYGIRTVPKEKWLCRKCETFEDKSIKVKCELCPSYGGALKPTTNNTWVHVVCALYMPEVAFKNIFTMEPVILSAIPRDSFNKICFICDEKNKYLETMHGACITCNKTGCHLRFHVTCAQSAGLLCEEEGNCYTDVKYVGYCKHHYSMLKKSDNIKPMTPFQPQNQPVNLSSVLTSEKELHQNNSNFQTLKRKSIDIDNFGKKMTNEKKVNDLVIQKLSKQNQRKSGSSYIRTTHSSESSIISTGTIAEKISTTRNLTSSPETSVISSPIISNEVPVVIRPTNYEVYENSTNVCNILEKMLYPLFSTSQKITDTFNEEIITHNLYYNHSNSSTCTQNNVVMDAQIQQQDQMPLQNQVEMSLPQSPALTASLTNEINNDTRAVEDLLERNWEQDEAIFMEQAQHFDIASLLSCLYQLKSENANLEYELGCNIRRRDHLKAVNAEIAVSFTPQNNSNKEPAPPTINNIFPEAHVPIQSPWPNYQNNPDSTESTLQHGDQIHLMSNRHPADNSLNNVSSQVVGGCVNQEQSLDNCREVNQHLDASNVDLINRVLENNSHDFAVPPERLEEPTET